MYKILNLKYFGHCLKTFSVHLVHSIDTRNMAAIGGEM